MNNVIQKTRKRNSCFNEDKRRIKDFYWNAIWEAKATFPKQQARQGIDFKTVSIKESPLYFIENLLPPPSINLNIKPFQINSALLSGGPKGALWETLRHHFVIFYRGFDVLKSRISRFK